jgi:hypothetical protein
MSYRFSFSCLKIKKVRGVAEAVQHLHCKYGALSSNSSVMKQTKKKYQKNKTLVVFAFVILFTYLFIYLKLTCVLKAVFL